jgi:hypothetical protein
MDTIQAVSAKACREARKKLLFLESGTGAVGGLSEELYLRASLTRVQRLYGI